MNQVDTGTSVGSDLTFTTCSVPAFSSPSDSLTLGGILLSQTHSEVLETELVGHGTYIWYVEIRDAAWYLVLQDSSPTKQRCAVQPQMLRNFAFLVLCLCLQ